MTHPADRMPEDRGPGSLESHLRKHLDDLCLFGHHHPDETQSIGKGWPDWVIIGAHGVLFRELKREHGTLSTAQRIVGYKLRANRLDWDVWRPSDLLSGRLLRELEAIT